MFCACFIGCVYVLKAAICMFIFMALRSTSQSGPILMILFLLDKVYVDVGTIELFFKSFTFQFTFSSVIQVFFFHSTAALKPFVVYVVTDANEGATALTPPDVANRGFSLTYTQIAC